MLDRGPDRRSQNSKDRRVDRRSQNSRDRDPDRRSNFFGTADALN